MIRRCPLLALVAAALLGGCSSAEIEPQDPDAELEAKLSAYLKAQDGVYADDHAGEVPMAGELRRSIEALNMRFPNHVPTLYASAVVSNDAKEFAKAQRYLDRLFRIQTIHPQAAVLRAELAVREGNLNLARRILLDHTVQVPDDAELHETLSGVLFMEGDLRRAKAHLLLAENLGAPKWRVLFNRGLIAEEEGDLETAQRHYEECLELKKDHAPARARIRGIQSGAVRPRGAHAPRPVPRRISVKRRPAAVKPTK